MNYDEQNRHINQIYRSFCNLYKDSIHQACPHIHVQKTDSGLFCKDCRHKVLIVWTQIICSSCGSKRIPKKESYGTPKPMVKYCKYCGSRNFKLVNQESVNVHEARYSVARKEIDTNPNEPDTHKQTLKRHTNPYFRRYIKRNKPYQSNPPH